MNGLNQDITHWSVTPSGYGGFTFGAPSTQRGRYEDNAEIILTPDGEEVISNARVYLTSDVAVGDYVAVGDQTGTSDPTTLSAAFRVLKFTKIPDLAALNNERCAYL